MAAYAAVISLDFVLTNIIHNAGLLISDKYPLLLETLEILHKELKSFAEFVGRLDMNSRMRMNTSLQQIAEVTLQFNTSFDSLLDRLDDFDGISDQEPRYVEDFEEETHSFIETLKKIQEEYLKQDIHLPNQHEVVDSKSMMIGLCDKYTKLKTYMFCCWYNKIRVFSIVGMAGIGKTALAKKLFEDLDVLEWFDCRVWVTLGRKYQPEEISQIIQAQLDIDANNLLITGGCLKKGLMGKRYLIVLDDVWDMELVNDYLETSFPNIENGSRVLITSRILHTMSFPDRLMHMRLLNKQESWQLLREKVFGQNSCSDELEKAGKQIAEKCDGLPLTIVIVADLLSKAEKTPGSLWIEVSVHKKHELFIDAYDEISKVLYPSYDNLREDSKLCFLYMGVFPPNCEIPKSKLINLWIVEKLIEKDSFPSLEINGVDRLKYFSLHNVVVVYERSTLFDGEDEKIKKCGLHSSWWHFCYKEARKNNFFYVMDTIRDASGEGIKSQSRLTIHNNVLFGIKVVHKSMEENCASTTHSLLCFGPYHPYPVSICFGLKLLKKLDALNIRFYEFPLEVLELVKLRYLALTCNASLPSSISKLWKLQYLIVHRHLNIKFGVTSYFPVEIWDMKRLKHLHVTSNDLPDVVGAFLPNLLTLSDVSFKSCTNGVFGRIPNLKKLGIRIDLIPDAIEPFCCCFDHVANLSELESLKCVIVNPTRNCEVVASVVPLSMFPINLKKLSLSGLGYCWEQMSMISLLPNLEVLKLQSNAFQGPMWIIEEDEFPKLSFLLMEDLDLVQLKGRNESFKCLKKVRIKDCYKLRKLRWRSNYKLATDIEVVDCDPLVEKEIQKSQLNSLTEFRCSVSIHSSWNS